MYDPYQIMGMPSLGSYQAMGASTPPNQMPPANQTTSAAVPTLDPQQMSMQQKLAMALMQGQQLQNQGQQSAAPGKQDPNGATSPYSSLAGLGSQFMGGMGGMGG